MKCHCGSEAKLVDAIKVYKKPGFGKVWLCSRYPTCDSFVGVHKDTGAALGTLANEPMREARKLAHAIFDKTWQQPRFGNISVFESRGGAYQWMQEVMGLDPDHAHIAMMDEIQCYTLIGHVAQLQKERYEREKATVSQGSDLLQRWRRSRTHPGRQNGQSK